MSREWTDRALLAGLLALFLGLVAVCWVGFIASDDVTYATGAYGWIEHFPYVGGHGTIRYTITIPMALAFLTFGENEVSMALPSLLYMLGAMVIGWVLVRSCFGRRAAVIALLLAATCPLFVIQASIANVDMIELFFQFASFAAFWRALHCEQPRNALLLSGALAGLAFLTRETAIFIAVFYGLLFLRGYRLDRRVYLWIPAGFLAIWALEIVYLWVMTGDPLYRINISLHHDSTIDRSIDVAGNLIVHPAIDPLLVLLANQEFMLLFWLALPAAAWLLWKADEAPDAKALARLLGLLGLVVFVCVGAVQHLLPLNPRYFALPTFIACLLLGIALSRWWARMPIFIALVLAGLLSTNALGSYVENRHSQFGAREYARLVGQSAEPIATDPMTHYRATLLLKWEDGEARALALPPRPGTLYFYNPVYADAPNARMSPRQAPLFHRPGGVAIEQLKPPRVGLLRLFEATGLDRFVPQKVLTKLADQHPQVELIRVG